MLGMRGKPWNANIAMKCVLEIDISHAREALKCESRYEMRAENQ